MAKSVQELKQEAAALLELANRQEKAEKDAARKAAQDERARIAKEHRDRMYSEIGQPLAGLNEAQHGIVYSQAYEQSHSSGYDDVEGTYGELAEMARQLLDAN